MPEAGYRQPLIEYIRQNARPPDKFSHQGRLYALARQIAELEAKPFDDEVLFAAAWLHDLGVFVGHRPDDPNELASWDHIAYAVAKVPPLLKHLGFPARKISAVCEAIRTHMPSGAPTFFEGILLRDADILEQLGAVGILRTVSKVGRDTRFILFSDALRVLQSNLENLPAQLRLPSARRLAESRVTFLRSFLAEAEAEALGNW